MELQNALSEQQKIDIRKRIQETSLHISDIPKEVKTRFIKLAKEQFTNDYSVCIRWLLDCAEGYFTTNNQILEEKINALADEIQMMKSELSSLKETTKPKEEKQIKTIGGKVICRS